MSSRWTKTEINDLIAGRTPEGRTLKACEVKLSKIRKRLGSNVRRRRNCQVAEPDLTDDIPTHTIIPVVDEVNDQQLSLPGFDAFPRPAKPKLGKFIVTLYKGGHTVQEIARVFSMDVNKVQAVLDTADMFV